VKRKLLIVDVEDRPTDFSKATPQQIVRIRETEVESRALATLTGEAFHQYGSTLFTVAKARAWLVDRRNWHLGQMFIIRWNGLRPTICETYGKKLAREWWDDGLPETVIVNQHGIREGRKELELDSVVE